VVDLPIHKTEHAASRIPGRNGPFVRGCLVALTVPGFILSASSAGFGALARDGGLSLTHALVMMWALFALPAQVVLVDQLARGGSLIAGAFAVMLIGVRMLPMTVTLAPHLNSPSGRSLARIVAVHAIAITSWFEGLRRLPEEPIATRLDNFLGIGTGLLLASLAGVVSGYVVAGALPTFLAAALLFLTPIYFILSLVASARVAADWLAVLFGALLGPAMFMLFPGFDLLFTGLIGGTLAHVMGRRRIRWDDEA